ncbi:acetyltransferase [Hazenella sp. IB182357]|uniref:Lysine N-acyltransferase MbtK n=1 Tax=Polycladospora coralii TaxID=2771432 RepID=A0A926NCB6_9BACL|nr:GNAT family N-acetyltransferase [Polycladospora coralii]MBD1372770.1 acetyltransferase [Polycladospora coralii]MBS7531162.1 acetyltransferase [Polycladospora coralii]
MATIYKKYDESLDATFTVRPFHPEKDFDLFYEWMHKRYIAPFWKLNVSREKLKEYINWTMSKPERKHYIIELDSKAFGFLMSYEVKSDQIKNYYKDYDETDMGKHVVIGERHHINHKYLVPFFKIVYEVIFNQNEFVKKIVSEPDYRNKYIIPAIEGAGAKIRGNIELPHKTATLTVVKREEFYK